MHYRMRIPKIKQNGIHEKKITVIKLLFITEIKLYVINYPILKVAVRKAPI